MSSYCRVHPLPGAIHEPLTSITHCLHLRKVYNCYQQKKLSAKELQSTVTHVGAKVVWFSPTKSMDENNYYGNVSFMIDWSAAVSIAGTFMYYIDQEAAPTHSRTRVLLSTRYLSHLPQVDLDRAEMPLIKEGSKFMAATHFSSKVHFFEVAIEADDQILKKLYAMSNIMTNNHPLYYHRKFCPHDKRCFSQLDKHEAKKMIDQRCPGMLSDISVSSDDDCLVPLKTYERRNIASQRRRGIFPHLLESDEEDESNEDDESDEDDSDFCVVPAPNKERKTEPAGFGDLSTNFENMSTGTKVAAGVVGVACLAAGIAALFSGNTEDKTKKKKPTNNFTW